MTAISEILDIKVSFQSNTWSDISFEPTIETVLKSIQSDKYKTQIETLRRNLDNGNKEYYDNFKKQLPAVTFSATFNQRRIHENIKTYNELIVIDIDKLDNEQLHKTNQFLLSDIYVFAFWRSPSNKGFKGLVSISYEVETKENNIELLHKSAFKKLSKHFIENYSIELDRSGSDITRLCFLSFDNELIIKKEFEKFKVCNEDISTPHIKSEGKVIKLKFSSNRDALYNPLGRNKQHDRIIMTNIIRHLRNKKLSITDSYEDWCKVAMAISNTFTFDIGLNYFLKLSSLDSKKYNEITCTNFLINCYETKKGNVNFSSIIYLANQKGYKTKNQKNGVAKGEG